MKKPRKIQNCRAGKEKVLFWKVEIATRVIPIRGCTYTGRGKERIRNSSKMQSSARGVREKTQPRDKPKICVCARARGAGKSFSGVVRAAKYEDVSGEKESRAVGVVV